MELADIGQPVKLALELHKQLRMQFGEVSRRVPLAVIANAVGIVGLMETETDSFGGMLAVDQGYGAIALGKGLRSGRRNFTLSQEIGHFLIPNHGLLRSRFECAKVDLSRERAYGNWATRPPLERIEVEANEFSATLLVPSE